MIKKIFIGCLVISLIILAIGLYYMVIKAGIPYQDAPAELLLEYNTNMEIGEKLTIIGFCSSFISAIILVITSILDNKKK